MFQLCEHVCVYVDMAVSVYTHIYIHLYLYTYVQMRACVRFHIPYLSTASMCEWNLICYKMSPTCQYRCRKSHGFIRIPSWEAMERCIESYEKAKKKNRKREIKNNWKFIWVCILFSISFGGVSTSLLATASLYFLQFVSPFHHIRVCVSLPR